MLYPRRLTVREGSTVGCAATLIDGVTIRNERCSMATATVRRFGRTAEPVLYEQRRTDSAGSTVGCAATGSWHRHDGQLDNYVTPPE